MIFHLKDEDKSLKLLMPYLRYGDYIVTKNNGSRKVKVVTYSGFEKVDPPDEEDMLNRLSSDKDIAMMLSEGSDIRFLLLSHPSNSFYVDDCGNILTLEGKRQISNIKSNGLPSQDSLEKAMVDCFYENRDCTFCEYYPLCGGYFVGRCESYHKEKFEDIRRAILRFRLNRSATVFVGFTCVNNCIFCAPADKRKERPLSHDEILDFIDRVSSQGCNSISFSGAGEPTLNPDLVEYVSFAKRKGIQNITVFTNGHNLNQSLLDQLVNEGCNGFLVSLHGNRDSHDKNVNRKGSYNEAISAVKMLTNKGIRFNVNTCITKYNITHLSEVIDTVKAINPCAQHSLSYPEISGNAKNNFNLIPGIVEASKAVMDLLLRDYIFLIEGLPLCLIKGFPINRIVRSSLDMYKDNLGERYSPQGKYIEACCFCPDRRICEGINQGYFELKGEEEVEKEIGGILYG